MRTSGVCERIGPWINATALSLSVFPSIPRISNGPNRVGSLARATIRMSGRFAPLREAPVRCCFLRGMKDSYYIRRLAEAALYIAPLIG
jgi:hypothetical protein